MNVKEIKEIIEIMKENNIDEFEMERNGLKICLKRGGKKEVQNIIVEEQRGVKSAQKEELPDAGEAKEENIAQIVSPMVGTFYASPSPDTAQYVVTGDNVSENTVVCIVEAMKVMNEINAEVDGKIIEILVKNGEPVEFGQPLFVVEKK